MTVSRSALVAWLDNTLSNAQISDYCPNGLQVEGSANIGHIVTGVTASQALIDAAIEENADAILVHHGYFWKGEPGPITGMKQRRIKALLANNINLLAYHLPIDVHPELGNNVQLGALLGIGNLSPLAGVKPEGVVYTGTTPEKIRLGDFAQRIRSVLGRDVIVEGDADKQLNHFAWCTGGGQGFIEQAANAGADVFFTGEVSEQTIHVAREMGIAFVSAGHHATERYGVKAVGEKIATQMDVKVTFIDIDNPA